MQVNGGEEEKVIDFFRNDISLRKGSRNGRRQKDGNPKRQAHRDELHRVGEKYHIDPRTAKRYAESSQRPEYTLSSPKPTKLDVYKQQMDPWLEGSAVWSLVPSITAGSPSNLICSPAAVPGFLPSARFLPEYVSFLS